MTKAARSKARRNVKAARRIDGYVVLGKTKEGLDILKPRFKATHFTTKELRAAIAKVLAAQEHE